MQEEEVQQQLRKVERSRQAASTSKQEGAAAIVPLSSQEEQQLWEDTFRNIPDSDDEAYYANEAQVTVNVLPGKPQDVPTTLFDENRRQVQDSYNRYQLLHAKVTFSCHFMSCVRKRYYIPIKFMCSFHVQAKEIADLQEDIVALEEELEAANVLCELKEEDKAVSIITHMKLSVCTCSD